MKKVLGQARGLTYSEPPLKQEASMAELDKLDQALRDYFEGNADKNKGATKERNALKIAEKEYAQSQIGKNNAPYTLKVNDKLSLEASYSQKEDFEIDAKKLFEENPEAFWQLVSIPMTNAKALLGEKEAAKLSRSVFKSGFKIAKVKE